MKFNLKIPISLFLTFAAAAFGTSFQLGYFSDVGASFISLASFADWLFVCAAVFPFAGIAYVLVDYLRPWIEKHLEQGTFRNNIVYAIFVSIFPILLFLLLVAELFPAWADTAVRALRLYIILWLMFTAVPSLHSIVKKISNSEPVRPTLALYAILHLSVLQFFIGALYAKAPSTVCRFYLTGGASEAVNCPGIVGGRFV